MSILTVTINPAVDKSVFVDHVVPDDKLSCRKLKYEAGGGGINVSRVLKRLSEDPTAFFQCSGPSGDVLLESLSKESLKAIPFKTINWTRENFIVHAENTGKQYRFGLPGPEYLGNEPEQFIQSITNFREKPEYLVLSGSIAPGFKTEKIQDLCAWAKKEHIKLILDTSGDALIEAMKVGAFLVKPNLKELCHITGKTVITAAEQEKLAMSIIQNKKAKYVVVSLGPRGAMMASEKGICYQVPPTVKVKSTVGAGDSMVAGMVYALKNGLENQGILQYGVACGTAATMNSGTGLCQIEDIQAILALMQKQLA